MMDNRHPQTSLVMMFAGLLFTIGMLLANYDAIHCSWQADHVYFSSEHRCLDVLPIFKAAK